MNEPSDDEQRVKGPWPPERVALVPCSGIQILDFEMGSLGNESYEYHAEKGVFVERLNRDMTVVGRGHRKAVADQSGLHVEDKVHDFTIDVAEAIEVFRDQWIPVPVLRRASGLEQAVAQNCEEYGPTDWTRMLIEWKDKEKFTYTVHLALDTKICDDGDPRRMLHMNDVANNVEFCLDDRGISFCCQNDISEESNTIINSQEWISDWIEHCFRESEIGKRQWADEISRWSFGVKGWAHYEVCLRAMKEKINVPVFQIRNTLNLVSPDYPAVDVDLVLDIGNSSTFGMLFEDHRSDYEAENQDLPIGRLLEIRDLGQPSLRYWGPLKSHVEFAVQRFGESEFAEGIPGVPTFVWPSLLRFGKEAQRLIGQSDGTERASGLLSPKRYLWDMEQPTERWRLHNEKESKKSANPDAFSVPTEVQEVLDVYNQRGDVISQVETEAPSHQDDPQSKQENRQSVPKPESVYNYDGSEAIPAIEPCFSRSALFGCLIQEILAHALVQLNDPKRSTEISSGQYPRKLKRVILTIPTAITMRERMIMKSRAEGALRALQDILRYTKTTTWDPDNIPEVVVEWDEASCSSLVYLYSEIGERFHSKVPGYFRLRGRPETATRTPSIRVACIDIGGGTTDLAIASYANDADNTITPQQEFHEGFRRAGDNVVHGIVESIVIPKIQEHLLSFATEGAGLDTSRQMEMDIREKLSRFFSSDVEDGSGLGYDTHSTVSRAERIQMRRLFALQVLVPLATELMSQAEQAKADGTLSVSMDNVLAVTAKNGDGPSSTVVDFFQQCVNPLDKEPSSEREYSLLTLEITVKRHEIDRVIETELRPVLTDFAQVIRRLECDIILLSGRPSRQPAVQAIIERQLLVRPDRFIPLHEYRAHWYPIRSSDSRGKQIGDPKTTVAVGAMLMQQLHIRKGRSFSVWTRNPPVGTSARYIGRILDTGRSKLESLKKESFKDAGDQTEVGYTFEFGARTEIGCRPFDLDQWPPTPLYVIDFRSRDESEAKKYKQVSITVKRKTEEEPKPSYEKTVDQRVREFAAFEELDIARAIAKVDNNGKDVKGDIEMRFCPIDDQDKAFLLDSGKFRVWPLNLDRLATANTGDFESSGGEGA